MIASELKVVMKASISLRILYQIWSAPDDEDV